MQCQDCMQDNALGSRFCTACGVPLIITCVACGQNGSPLSQFCGQCGAPRTAVIRLEPCGERKQATVLFADIVGSTGLIADLDAEAAKDRLEPLVKAMARAVRRFDGTVLRSLGDGLKAAFGVPHAQEDHALLACQAALAMRDAIAGLAGAPTLRIGLHSGEVVVGTLDTGSAVEQEVQGVTVHLASRMEHAAEPGSILISGECRALIGAYCDTTALGRRTFKGMPHAVEVYRLIGLKPAVNSDHFRGGGHARLRGRAAELAALHAALEGVGGDTGNVIRIVAPAGVGKSRLCFEFGEWCRARRVEVLEARAHVFGQATPLLPVLEVLRAFFRISPVMDPAAARQRIAARLQALDPALADGLALVADFLNVADPAHAAPTLDPATRHARLRDIIARMVKAAGRRASVIIIEDLHWLDDASRDFVATIMQAAAGTNILLVVTLRQPWSAAWMPQTQHQELRLVELDQYDSHELVRELTGDAPTLERVVTHVVDQAGGNPFFAEELVLSLAQSGVLLGQRGDYRLAPSGWRDPVLPATVEAVIGARIDRLSERQKAVLQIGAVIGKEFPLSVVQHVAGIAGSASQLVFDQLCALGMIQPCSTDAGASFAFRHPLIQEVAYAMQLRTRRTRLHEAVANTIRQFDWGLRDEAAGLLAHHYEAAGQDQEAVMHLQRAARWIGRTNSARALADWKKLRRMLQDQPRSATNDQLRALAGGQLLTFGWREGMDVEEAKLYAEEALRYAREAGNRKHEVLLLGGYGRIVAASGSADDYVRLVREALALTDAETNPEGTLLLHGLLSQACVRAGMLRDGLAANDAALAAIDAPGEPNAHIVLGLDVAQMVGFDVAHWVRCLRAKLLVACGELDAADVWLARLFQIEPGKIEPFHQFIPHSAAVELAWHRGDAAAATWHADETARYAEQSAIPFIHVTALLTRGIAASACCNYVAAEQHFLAALDRARQGKAGLENEAKLLAHLADAYLRAGDRKRASRTAAAAIEVARRRADRMSECHALLVAALASPAATPSEPPPYAAGLLDQAESLLGITGALFYLPMLQQARTALDGSGILTLQIDH